MKVIRLIFLLILFSFRTVNAEQLDTIRINENVAATLQFSSDVGIVVIANNPVINVVNGQSVYKYYDMFTTGGVIILRAKTNQAPTTSITITTKDNKLFTGYIMYDEKSPKNFYNYTIREEQTEKEPGISIEQDKISEEDPITERLDSIMSSRESNIYNLAKVEGRVMFRLEQILNDEQHSYIRISVDNQSASKYEIKGVMFRHITGKNRSIKKKDVVNTKWLDPVKKEMPDNEIVKAYKKQYIGFVIPVYSSDGGSLMIRIAENEGQRNCELKVPSKVLNKVEIYE